MNNNYRNNDPRYTRENEYYSSGHTSGGFDDGFDDDFDDAFTQPPAASPARREAPPASPVKREAPAPVRRDSEPDYRERPIPRRSHSAAFNPGFSGRPANTGYAPIEPLDTNPAKKIPPLLPFVICLAAMCLMGAFFLSSGDIISYSSSVTEHLSANLDMEIGFDAILTSIKNTAHGLPAVYTLPMNESPAQPPAEENYSTYTDENGIVHNTYIDPTITVDCWRQRYQVNQYSIMAAVAKVKIAHPTQLRTALAGGQYGSTRLKPSTISKQVNAIIAINGDLYNYSGKDTLMIRQGTVYRDGRDSYNDVLYIDSNGDFTIMRGNEARASGFYPSEERTIYQTITFGPPLVMDGEVVQFDHGIVFNCFYRNPRSAIGQTGPLEYVLVAVEGRSDESKGLSTNDLAYLMHDLGCIQAYNLDGGQSSMMIYRGKPFNHISNNGERTFSDIIYFGSAMPQE